MAKYNIYDKSGKLDRVMTLPSRLIEQQIGTDETYELLEPDIDARDGYYNSELKKLNKTIDNMGVKVAAIVEEDTKENAKAMIDLAAGRARTRYISDGALINLEYNQISKQVIDWRNLGSPADNVPVMITVRAETLSITVEDAAKSVEDASLNYENIINQTFSIRTIGKKAVDDAKKNFIKVAEKYVKQLDDL